MSRRGDDLLALTAELVEIPSVSHDERRISTFVADQLGSAEHLEISRVGHNVVARTSLGRSLRLLIAGHLDTVPPNGNDRAIIEGDRCSGLGAADMKGGVAVMLDLARHVTEPAIDVTYVWYACEEVEQRHSGLLEIEAEGPQLLAADAAVLAEPTSAFVEAGCQGVLRVAVRLGGARAHTARPWTGVNAIHRLGPVLRQLELFVERRPTIDGCEYREALQAVGVKGGVANNVVPDEVLLILNHRFAPDRTPSQAFEALRELLAPVIDEQFGDRVELEDSSLAAAPNLAHPLLASLVVGSGTAPRAKLGWTDVSFFTARGVPAANFGPGDPLLAHTAGEWVGRSDLEVVQKGLESLLSESG